MIAKNTTIRGVITPCDWEDDETVTSVIISADDEQEYFIDNYNGGRKLTKFIHKSIIATGYVRLDDKGHRRITIKQYTVLSPAGKKHSSQG